MPKVSVIVPSYNYAPFLELRIESLLSQTFRDQEIIVVDDGSTDGSQELIRRYEAASAVRAVYYQVNSGKTYQRWNDGASRATGQYLLFAGADDYCDHG